MIAVGLALLGVVQARPKSYEAAVSVLGQSSLSAEVSSDPPTARSFDNADGVAVDPTTGKLFVSDSENHRILRFSATAAYQTNAAAEAVLGQADFVSQQPNRGQVQPSANSLFNPSSLCCDAQGRLWVCDFNNARVLRFDAASAKASGAPADGVIGQGDFTTGTSATPLAADGGFGNPAGVAVDGAGNLWVSDASIAKVLRFDDAAALGAVYDGAADGFLGKVSAGEFVAATTVDGFGSGPGGVSLDPQGRLWVSDPTNNRVLRFDGALGTADGAAADGVLGQVDLVSGSFTAPPSASTMSNPYSVTAAPDGTVWVSDFVNNRVLGFVDAAAKANGADADLVLGQPDFISDIAAPNSPQTILSPSQVAIGQGGSILVTQYRAEGLVKRWSDPVTITAPKNARANRLGIVRLEGSASGAERVQFRVGRDGNFRRAKGAASAWRMRFRIPQQANVWVVVRSVAFDGRSATSRVRVSRGN